MSVTYVEHIATLNDAILGDSGISGAITAWTNTSGVFTFNSAPVYIRAFASRTGFVRVFPRGDENGVVANIALTNLPTVTKVTANSVAGANGSTVYDDAAPWYLQGGVQGATGGAWGAMDTGNAIVGSYHIVLTPASGDTVNSSSPQIFTLEPGAIIVWAAAV